MKKGDKVRFKVVHYTQNRAAGVETDVVKEGKCIGHDGEYLVVRVGSMKLPYIVHPDSVICEV
ncbi:MAG: hypothetical protein OXH00_02875 [Candidatus Poribacteria bacterium]|nr:hypothetical protein [Candidatus Poribacteria bacterium]